MAGLPFQSIYQFEKGLIREMALEQVPVSFGTILLATDYPPLSSGKCPKSFAGQFIVLLRGFGGGGGLHIMVLRADSWQGLGNQNGV